MEAGPETHDSARTVPKELELVLDLYGLILESDSHLPSVVSTIIGVPIHTSWWNHSKSRTIYAVLGELTRRPDILTTKLLSRKVTFLHRRLWPDFLAIANSNETWQFDKLSPEGNLLLEATRLHGQLRTNEYSKVSGTKTMALGAAARELESRLLLYGEGFHTSSGAHAKLLKTWEKWMRDTHYDGFARSAKSDEAKQTFEGIVEKLKDRYGVRARLPWDMTRITT